MVADRQGGQYQGRMNAAAWVAIARNRSDNMRKLTCALALAILAGIGSAAAQNYPSRQITLIVPFPPGGSTDVAARIMAERMKPILGQPIIIENVGGAGGSMG